MYGIEEVTREALKIVSPVGRPPYISIGIDVVDPAYAPGTNSLEPGGMTSREIINGVQIVARNGVCGFDVVEVSPYFDALSGITRLSKKYIGLATFIRAPISKKQKIGMVGVPYDGA